MAENYEVNVNQMLNDTIVTENVHLEEFDVGSDSRKQAIEALEKFYKLRIEENKACDEVYKNQENRKMELQMHTEKLELEKAKYQLEVERLAMEKGNRVLDEEERKAQAKTEKLRLGVDIGKSVLALGAWVLMSYKVMKFEETGSIRSKAFTGTIPKLKFW